MRKIFNCVYTSYSNSCSFHTFRLEIQAKLRQLGQKPGITARNAIKTARDQLAAMVQELKTAMHVACVVEIHCTTIPTQEPLEIWDEIMNELVPGSSNNVEVLPQEPAPSGPIQIEDQIMPLPSNGNVEPEYA